MRRASFFTAALAAVMLAAATAQGMHPPSTPAHDELLYSAIAAPANVSYTGTVEVLRMGTRAAEADVYRVEHRAPNLTRRTYTAPAVLAGETVVARGDLLFSIDQRRRRIVETRNDAADPNLQAAEYALLRENYTILEKGYESFDGRRAIDVALMDKQSRRMAMLVRIDAVTRVALARQEFAPDGALVSEVRFEAIAYSTPVPAADFVLPQQYAIVRDPGLSATPQQPQRALASAGFAVRAPRTLPGGFAPVEGDVVELRGVRTLHLLYSDGIRTISLFENAQASTLEAARMQLQSMRIGERDATYAEDGPTALLAWSDGGLHYTLVGEVGLVDLPHLAEVITP